MTKAVSSPFQTSATVPEWQNRERLAMVIGFVPIESAMLRTYWVLVMMDQFTRRIVGFAVHRGVVDGMAL